MSGDGKYFPIRWTDEDWKLVTDGVELLKAETHIDVTPTDFIRAGVRRLYETLSAQPVAKAS